MLKRRSFFLILTGFMLIQKVFLADGALYPSLGKRHSIGEPFCLFTLSPPVVSARASTAHVPAPPLAISPYSPQLAIPMAAVLPMPLLLTPALLFVVASDVVLHDRLHVITVVTSLTWLGIIFYVAIGIAWLKSNVNSRGRKYALRGYLLNEYRDYVDRRLFLFGALVTTPLLTVLWASELTDWFPHQNAAYATTSALLGMALVLVAQWVNNKAYQWEQWHWGSLPTLRDRLGAIRSA